ncbi:hypothetical protein CEXT_124211 [Caerostris extrusa]|uniref:Uncharacterized protein n=1 Tax=Caerostris extrusa TaxID=172846 RepID=A0AAV4R5F4_CAEEX|nr:hypothetical protein CEXT_124211 [Caerostris extrusa]
MQLDACTSPSILIPEFPSAKRLFELRAELNCFKTCWKAKFISSFVPKGTSSVVQYGGPMDLASEAVISIFPSLFLPLEQSIFFCLAWNGIVSVAE